MPKKKPQKEENFEGMFEVGDTSRPQDVLDQLHAKLDEAIALQETIAQLEDSLKAAKSALHHIRADAIPSIMSTLQMEGLTYKGWKVEIGEIVSGSFPKDPEKKAKAIEWLRNNDAEGIIKTTVTAAFGKGEDNIAGAVAEAMNATMKEIGFEGEAIKESGVHAQTLMSFGRERLANGEPLDAEVLGLFINTLASFKKAKASKK